MIRRVVLSLMVVSTFLGNKPLFGQQVVVTPEETDEILANPGMGWETFHETRKQDKSLPTWIPSTIQYARWGWGELEPQPGKLNTEFLEKVLKDTITTSLRDEDRIHRLPGKPPCVGFFYSKRFCSSSQS